MSHITSYIEIKNLVDLKKSLEPFDKNTTVIVNWCEFLNQKEGTAHLVTQFLEERGYIFTGADTACLKLTSSKEQTKKRLIAANILTPNYTVITTDTDFTKISLKFPIMLKLEDRHSSVGITNENVVNNIEQLAKVSQRLIQKYHANVLAEEYIDGPEYTATVWGNGNKAV